MIENDNNKKLRNLVDLSLLLNLLLPKFAYNKFIIFAIFSFLQ